MSDFSTSEEKCSDVHLSDIIGIDEYKEDLLEVINYFKNP